MNDIQPGLMIEDEGIKNSYLGRIKSLETEVSELKQAVVSLTNRLNDAGALSVPLPASPADYTVTNALTDRSYNANSTTTDELADVIATIIADLTELGVFQ